ncbi:MAG TPA: YncE family protein [Gemmatimonadales bacterium]|nr:YncE family protein [Gemmatimonadales bacterium]
MDFKRVLRAAALCLAWTVPVVAQAPAPPAAPTFGYRLYVVSESGDIVTQLGWDGTTLKTIKTVPVGVMPADIDGPHNVTVSPDGHFYYVTVAHGTPYGSLWKMAVDADTLLGRAPVELFPTTISVTPDGELAFVANSDFYGDHPRTNLVSVIYTPRMTPLTNIAACDMPHGVKVNHAGTFVYVSCMNSDEVLEIDRQSLAITRRHRTGGAAMAGQAMGGMTAGVPQCMPTFVSLSPDDTRLYVACNHANTLQVIDAATLALVKEIPTGTGAYNVEPSPDGRWVIVTNKKAQSVSVISADSLVEVARIATTKKIPHGIVYAPDGRYAFVSQESIGVDPGAVDVIDLTTRTRVATVPVPLQPTGITLRVLP